MIPSRRSLAVVVAAILAAAPAVAARAQAAPGGLFVRGVPAARARAACQRARGTFECGAVFETAVYGTAVAGATRQDIARAFGFPGRGAAARVGADRAFSQLGGMIHAVTSLSDVRDASFVLAHGDRIVDDGAARRRLRQLRMAVFAWQQSLAPGHLAFLNEAARRACGSGVECVSAGTFRYAGSGEGVTVYYVGARVQEEHIDFVARRTANAPAAPRAYDACESWYGTHSAALVNGMVHGVAKSASVVATQVVDGCLESFSVVDLAQGLQWALDAVRARGRPAPAVALLSHVVPVEGSDAATVDSVEDLVRALTALNVTVVALAGARAGDACDFSPQRMREVVTVAAVEVTRGPGLAGGGLGVLRATPWPLSNAGPCVDVWAPGAYVESAMPPLNSTTAVMSGTMQAASVAAGVVAVALEREPGASPARVKELLASEPWSSDAFILAPPPNTTDRVVQVA